MKKLLAEAIGTFGLVFCGTGAIIVDEMSEGALGVAGIALVFGVIVFLMILAFGRISGAHLNPAVTIALSVREKGRWHSALPYIGMQLIGALLASLLLRILFPTSVRLGSTIPSGAPMASYALEALLTFLLMFVIHLVSTRSRGVSALLIGATVGMEALLAGPISGASMNPARTIAPAIVEGDLAHIPFYTVATILGALAATLLWGIARRSPARQA